MKVFLAYVRDETFSRVLPRKLDRPRSDDGRIKVMAFPPLGIQTLAPVLRQHGHEVWMFDTCHPQMKAEDIARAVGEQRPHVAAISILSTTAYAAAKAMVKQLKAVSPRMLIIVGGPYPTMNADRILSDCSDIDCVGVGEGEELLPEYLKNLDCPDSVKGLVWRNAGKIVRNAPRALIRNLDQFPYADRTSLPIDYIESMPLDVPAVLSLDKFCTVQTSRGCPYSCIYCDIPSLSEGKWRCRSAEHVLGEMQQLSDRGYRSIYLTDDHFLLNRKRISAICSGIIERGLKFRWGCEGRVDSTAIDQLPTMVRAGCDSLCFGVESGSQKVLDRLNKRQTLAQIEHAISEAKRHGIAKIHGFFVIGCPGESESEIVESFRFAARLRLDTFGFNRLCVYRGTPLWREYVQRGIINDERDWQKWFKCADIDPTCVSMAAVIRARTKGWLLIFARRIFGRPIQTCRLLRTFARYMKMSDLLGLLLSPFHGRSFARVPELTARMIDLGLKEPERVGSLSMVLNTSTRIGLQTGPPIDA